MSNEQGNLNLARTFTYYCINQFFLKENQLINNLKRITHLPAIIVHGRFDAIYRAKSSFELHKNWPGSEIFFIQNEGHSASAEGIAKALINATEKMKLILK